MRELKALLGTTVLLAGLALAPAAQSQIVVNIGVQPTCAYGYYDYQPYSCAPRGYYGPGYFYNGIFLGMGPWAGWGYGHGWGSHRFINAGGGRYRGNGGALANRSNFARGRAVGRASGPVGHHAPPRAPVNHAPVTHGNGAGAHGGGQAHGGGEAHPDDKGHGSDKRH